MRSCLPNRLKIEARVPRFHREGPADGLVTLVTHEQHPCRIAGRAHRKTRRPVSLSDPSLADEGWKSPRPRAEGDGCLLTAVFRRRGSRDHQGRARPPPFPSKGRHFPPQPRWRAEAFVGRRVPGPESGGHRLFTATSGWAVTHLKGSRVNREEFCPARGGRGWTTEPKIQPPAHNAFK